MEESVGNVMPTNGLLRDGLLPRLSAPQRLLQCNVFCSFLGARFSDSFTVLDDLLLSRVDWKVSSGFRISLVCQDKARFLRQSAIFDSVQSHPKFNVIRTAVLTN